MFAWPGFYFLAGRAPGWMSLPLTNSPACRSQTLLPFFLPCLPVQYPELMPFVRVTLINSGAILNQFDSK